MRTTLNVSDSLYEALSAAAKQERRSMTAVLEAAIEAYTAAPQPALCLGYIQVARSGDADALTCAGCGGQIASLPWLAVMAAGATIHLDGPYCPGCATSE